MEAAPGFPQAVPPAPAALLPDAAVAGTAASMAAPVVRTPKAPASRPDKKNRPSPLLNIEVRSPASNSTPASADKSPKEVRKRPPPLAAVPSKVSPCVDTSFVSQCDQWGGAKGRTGSQGSVGPRGEAVPRGISPRCSPEALTSPLVRALTSPLVQIPPQPGSEGASTTASSTGEWWELQGPEELEYVRRLGQGSSGVVEKHRHARTGKELALKIIHASNIAEPQRKAILLELRTFRRCRNPHIVDFYGAFFHENNIHIGLEYMDAGALSSVLEIRGTVPEHLLANITWQVLDGLEYLHCEMHVIHRDIKPSNLLLSSAGVVKITDFGVSGELEDDLRESTGKVTWVGTIYYMSPERAQGLSYRYDSDMWSLGLTLIECLCGRFPYLDIEACMKQLSFWELMRRIVEQDAPRVPPDAGYSPQVQDFIQQVLQKDSRNRLGSAMMKTHAWLSKAAAQADVAAWIEQSGVVGEPKVAREASRSTSVGSSSLSSPVKSSSSSGHAPGDLDFVNVSGEPASVETRIAAHGDGGTPMDRSVRGGANPFMMRAPSNDGGAVATPSERQACRSGEDPFAQFAPGLEASSEWPSSASRSLRHSNGENPFLQRGASGGLPRSPGVETASSPSTGSDGAPRLPRGVSTVSSVSPMSKSLRGGENPFLQRASSNECDMGYRSRNPAV